MPLPNRTWRPTPAQVLQLRISLNLTLTDFAARMGVTRRTAVRWERGDTGGAVLMTAPKAIRRFRRLAREAGWDLSASTQGPGRGRSSSDA